jgi:hypothetical protein
MDSTARFATAAPATTENKAIKSGNSPGRGSHNAPVLNYRGVFYTSLAFL